MLHGAVNENGDSLIRKTLLKLVLIILTLAVMPVYAAGGDSSDWGSELAKFKQLIEERQFQQAIDELDAALKQTPDDADLLNLMAYSHRQLENFDNALDYYQKALEIEPKHRGANEYLDEFYLRLGQLEKAQQRLSVLDKACFFGCEEFDELEQAIEEYRRKYPS
ncbi:MAG: tetratricopeptide repeat protein [Gammaproteobacteria bacterium]|nr:tetratricopeptide repeat protein [Gammaproteobacteria bacterium]